MVGFRLFIVTVLQSQKDTEMQPATQETGAKGEDNDFPLTSTRYGIPV
jgi:hypothetical protein